MYPFPSASYSASESAGGARGLGNIISLPCVLCPPSKNSKYARDGLLQYTTEEPSSRWENVRWVPPHLRRQTGALLAQASHSRSAMQAAQQQELEAMTDMFNKCAPALSALQRVSSSLSRQPRVAAG